MRINAVSSYSTMKQRKLREATTPITTPVETSPQAPTGMAMISFKSGNPKHIAHVVAEEPLFGFNGGGVGTVVNDYNYLDKDAEKVIKLIPLYNQDVTYEKTVDPKTGKPAHPKPKNINVRYIPKDLPADHPFKVYEGNPFVTVETIDKSTNLSEFLIKNAKKDNVFLLEEVKSSNMNWGMEENVPIKMFRAKKEGSLLNKMNEKGMSKELQDKLEFIFTYVDSTASMPKQYADGSYAFLNGEEAAKKISSNWSGQAYPKYNKATVELLPALKEKYNLDPKYLLCSDGQSMFTMHYAAEKNAAQDAYWMDKFLGGVGHNMNAGYDQPMGARQAIVNLGATKKELTTLLNSKEYIEALKNGTEEKFLNEHVLKNFQPQKGSLTAYHVPIYYAKNGYVPMLTTVSEGYHESIISNDLISTMHEELKELDKLGRFKGLTNPLMDPDITPFKDSILHNGYKKDLKLNLADGTEVVVPKFKVFDQAKKYDLNHVREIKQYNKINLLERFDKKFIGAQLFDADANKWLNADSGRMEMLAGKSNRKAKIYGEIGNKYLEALKKGEDVKFITSWGRGDFQKGMDIVIDSFEKFVAKNPNEKAVLIMGGDMQFEPQTVEKFQLASSKPSLQGKMIFMDGWAPGKDFAMASDVALLPSRFAPCELTDLEAKKALCTPIVPNVQGMAQKNFDPSIAEEALKMDGYKGKHEFFMTEEVALKAANENAKKDFNEVKEVLANQIKNKYKGQVNEEIPAELLKKSLEENDKYQKALRKLRDSVIADEMSECMERALIKDRTGSIPETILKNQVNQDTTWFGNGWLSKTKKSAGELYQEYHFNNKGKNIGKKDLIKLNFSGLTDLLSEGSSTVSHNGGEIVEGKTNNVIKSKGGKIALGIAAAIAVLGAGYALFKKSKAPDNNNATPNFANVPKPAEGQAKNLSAVV